MLLRSVKCDNLSPPPLIHAGTDHPGEDTGCIFLRKERAGGGGGARTICGFKFLLPKVKEARILARQSERMSLNSSWY